MPLAGLDIPISVDASSAVSGFNRAAAATRKFNTDVARMGKGVEATSRTYAKSMKGMQVSTANVSAQFNDIALQLASGVSPFTVAIQQSGQLAAALGTGGLSGALRGVAAGFASLLSPVSLITFGLIAAGGAAIQWLTSLKTELPGLDDLLKEHLALIEAIKARYPELAGELDKLGKAHELTELAKARGEVEAFTAALVREAETIRDTLGGGNFRQWQLPEDFKAFEPAIMALREAAIAGTADLGAFFDQIDRTAAEMGGGDLVQIMVERIKALGTAITEQTPGILRLQDIFDRWDASVAAGRPNVRGLLDDLLALDRSLGGSDPRLRAFIDRLALIAGPALSAANALDQSALAAGRMGGAAGGAIGNIEGLAAALRNAAAADAQFLASHATLSRLAEPSLSAAQQATKAWNDLRETQGVTIEQMIAGRKDFDAAMKNIASEPANQFGPQLPAPDFKAREASAAGAAKLAESNKLWVQSLLDAGDPMRAINRDIERLNELQAEGALAAGEHAAGMVILQKRAADAASAAKDSFDVAKTFESMMTSWGDQVASSFADAIVEGESLEDVFRDLIKMLAKMALEMLVLKPIMAGITGGISGMFGGTASVAAPPLRVGAVGTLPMARQAGGSKSGPGPSTTFSRGSMVINIGTGAGVPAVEARGEKATAMARRIRDVVQNELVSQQRPGGILYVRT